MEDLKTISKNQILTYLSADAREYLIENIYVPRIIRIENILMALDRLLIDFCEYFPFLIYQQNTTRPPSFIPRTIYHFVDNITQTYCFCNVHTTDKYPVGSWLYISLKNNMNFRVNIMLLDFFNIHDVNIINIEGAIDIVKIKDFELM